MTHSEYRKTYSWQGAIELGPSLARLADELPAGEAGGMALILRQLMVELPAVVALDLMHQTDRRFETVVRLEAALELVGRVYPALDPSDCESMLASLVQRLGSADFAEMEAVPVVVQSEAASGLAVETTEQTHEEIHVHPDIIE